MIDQFYRLTPFNSYLDSNGKFYLAIKEKIEEEDFENFDQSGYAMSGIEQKFAKRNKGIIDISPHNRRPHESVFSVPWYTFKNSGSGLMVDHCELFQRVAVDSIARDQVEELTKEYPAAYKLLHMKPKWGFDISIDWVDSEKAFEVFHYEWDSFDYEEYREKRKELEEFLAENIHHFQSHAQAIWKRRSEWIDLDFMQQSKWRTNYYSLDPERFKQTVWNKISEN